MKTVLLTAAQSGAIDQGSNLLSIFNVLDDFSSATFPIALPVTVIAIFERDLNEPNDPQINLVIKLDNEDPIFERRLPFNFQGKKRARVFGVLQSLVVPRPGMLSFEMKFSNQTIGSWFVEIEQAEQELKVRSSTQQKEPRKKSAKKASKSG